MMRRANGEAERRSGDSAAGRDRVVRARSGAAALVGLLMLALSAPAAIGQPHAGPVWPDNPLHGRLQFEAKHCNQCHGIAGSGPGIGSDLAEGRLNGSFLELGAALWNHVPGMSVRMEEAELPWPRLSDGEAVELTAFLYAIDYLGRPGDAAPGRRIFNEKGCTACHAIGGNGETVGPDLAELKLFVSPLYMAQAIWNHGPSMLESMQAQGIAPPSFNDGDLADLSAYIRQTGRPGPRERMLLAPGNPNRGRGVFQAKGCSTCHTVAGQGGQGGPDLAESDLHRPAEAIVGTMWNHALAMSASMRDRGVGWPDFTIVELADLIAFLYFLPFVDPPGDPAGGGAVFARSCADCHAGGGITAHPGPDLADSRATRSAAALVAAMWNHAPVMKEAILGAGRPWPELSGNDLRNLLAYLEQGGGHP